MKKPTLQDIIIKYLQTCGADFVNGGELERLALEKGYKGSNADRTLRKMREDGIITLDKDRDQKHTVWYSINPTKYRKETYTVKFPEGDKLISKWVKI